MGGQRPVFTRATGEWVRPDWLSDHFDRLLRLGSAPSTPSGTGTNAGPAKNPQGRGRFTRVGRTMQQANHTTVIPGNPCQGFAQLTA